MENTLFDYGDSGNSDDLGNTDDAEKISTVYAATDATFINLDFPADIKTLPVSILKFRKTFYRLTPSYWAWFLHKYKVMEKALVAGKISERTFTEILDRVSTLYNHAAAIFGKEAIDQACESGDIAAVDEMVRGGNKNAGTAGVSTGESALHGGVQRRDVHRETTGSKNMRSYIPSLVAERGR